MDKFYVYRFLDKDANTIYIGRTKNLERRLTQEHFTRNGHLPQQCYRECHSIEYMEFDVEAEMKIYELYFINYHNPKYNVMENRNENFTFSLEEHWTKYKINDIMNKKEYKLYSYIVMHSDSPWVMRTDIDTLSDGIKIKDRMSVMRILNSLSKKSYIQLRVYGQNLTITHSIRDLKFPKEDLDE